MKNTIARTQKDINQYRKQLFQAKEAYRKKQASLSFERKIEIVMKLNRFAKAFKKDNLEND